VLLVPHEIISIQPAPRQIGYLLIRYGTGKLTLINQFDGFHELIAYIKAANPTMKVTGI